MGREVIVITSKATQDGKICVEHLLSPRELQVMRLLAHGMGCREVSQLLDVSEKTTCTHMDNIAKKLELNRKEVRAVASILYGEIELAKEDNRAA
jgi:DNA-binding NarL/FixJ family response regulator